MALLSQILQMLGSRDHAQSRREKDESDRICSDYVLSQQLALRDQERRGKCWTRHGGKLVLDGFPMITIRRSTPEEVAQAFGVGVFCVECGSLPPQFPSTLELAKSLGQERAQEIDTLPLTDDQSVRSEM